MYYKIKPIGDKLMEEEFKEQKDKQIVEEQEVIFSKETTENLDQVKMNIKTGSIIPFIAEMVRKTIN